ncbi:Casein kinase II beta 2 subunit [Geosmithia morbida]|uniref:Casein kinase II beta 2 subunit n=1 Tax=Geosmithia morbida TaxID=1094350 RepID=A0A9P4YYL4_9HYPO|nr:Casein kinase II beta 2 subunit [Geosmithia morbida]KAF4124063.1 Casein kinase II beta 2 subunit [Geosmithia morbida]
MASMGGLWGSTTLRLLRVAVSRTASAFRTRVANASKPRLQPIPIQTTGRQPLHPAAVLKQRRAGGSSRWFSSGTTNRIDSIVRRYFSSSGGSAPRLDRSKLPRSKTSQRVAQFSGRAPFASTLRPNLTGGAMPRTAGGYTLGGGGGARYFSHGPAAPAQVVQNVSQAMRAFFLSGQKLRYDGMGARGEHKYRAVSDLEDKAMNKLAAIHRNSPGAFVDFQLSPTMTALSPLAAAISGAGASTFNGGAQATEVMTSLNTDGFLDVLSADFGRALKELTAVYADLRRLAVLGDLPITMEKHGTIRVRFPGVDAETATRLCDDIGLQRGIVGEDADLEATVGHDDTSGGLKFPFAPESYRPQSITWLSDGSLERHDGISSIEYEDCFVYDSSVADDKGLDISDMDSFESVSLPESSGEHASASFEGLEGIYWFIEECDRNIGRLG